MFQTSKKQRERPVVVTGGSSRRFWGRPTWRSDRSQGTPKTKNSSDLAHYFLGSGPKSRTKIKIYKKGKQKKSGFRSLLYHGSPWLVRWDPDSFREAVICFTGPWFVMKRSDSSCGVLIRPAHGRSHHYGQYGRCSYKFRNAQKLVRNARSICRDC